MVRFFFAKLKSWAICIIHRLPPSRNFCNELLFSKFFHDENRNVLKLFVHFFRRWRELNFELLFVFPIFYISEGSEQQILGKRLTVIWSLNIKILVQHKIITCFKLHYNFIKRICNRKMMMNRKWSYKNPNMALL